jgi:phosphomethylpyrimidine synthase
VRISKEIQEFASGKEEKFAWDKPKVTAALTAEQQEILKQRGVLSPQEIHELANKTKTVVGVGKGAKASCHSDYVDDEKAKRLQEEKLVQLNTGPAHHIGKGSMI